MKTTGLTGFQLYFVKTNASRFKLQGNKRTTRMNQHEDRSLGHSKEVTLSGVRYTFLQFKSKRAKPRVLYEDQM